MKISDAKIDIYGEKLMQCVRNINNHLKIRMNLLTIN